MKWLQTLHSDHEQYCVGTLMALLLNLGAELDDLRDDPPTAEDL